MRPGPLTITESDPRVIDAMRTGVAAAAPSSFETTVSVLRGAADPAPASSSPSRRASSQRALPLGVRFSRPPRAGESRCSPSHETRFGLPIVKNRIGVRLARVDQGGVSVEHLEGGRSPSVVHACCLKICVSRQGDVARPQQNLLIGPRPLCVGHFPLQPRTPPSYGFIAVRLLRQEIGAFEAGLEIRRHPIAAR